MPSVSPTAPRGVTSEHGLEGVEEPAGFSRNARGPQGSRREGKDPFRGALELRSPLWSTVFEAVAPRWRVSLTKAAGRSRGNEAGSRRFLEMHRIVEHFEASKCPPEMDW